MSLQYSDDSEGSQLRDLVDNEEPQYSPDGYDRPFPPSPRAALLSMVSNGDLAGRERSMRSRGKEPERRHKSSRSRNLMKILLNEEYEVKQTRRVLSAALDRLDSETRRAQEAERRALELAERFKIVNDARLAAQQEARRAVEELQMYRLQLGNAQKEIDRASDLLRDIEAQRDDAEAAAARARTTARRLREQQLVYRAKEEGRRQGYEEGMKTGYEDGRAAALSGAPPPEPAEEHTTPGPRVTFEDEQPSPARRNDMDRTAPLDDFPSDLRNFPAPLSDIDQITLNEPEQITVIPPPGEANGFQPGAQGSRFRENIASPGASTINVPPPGTVSQPQPWPAPPGTSVNYNRSPASQNRPLSSGISDYTDTMIPELRPGDSYMNIPPPHSLSRLPGSPRSPAQPLPTLPQVPVRRAPSDDAQNVPPPGSIPIFSRDYASAPKNRMSPGSLAESLPSTTMSQFDLLSSPRSMARRAGRERDRDGRSGGLSAIQEVPPSMELFSPSTENSSRRNTMPNPIVFPAPAEAQPPVASGGPPLMNGPPLGFIPQVQREPPAYEPSADDRRRLADQLRYSNPNMVEEWRRSASESLSPPSGPPKPRPMQLTTPEPLSRSASVGARSQASLGAGSSHHRSQSMHSGVDATTTSSGSKSRRRVKSPDEYTISVEPPPVRSPEPLVLTIPNSPRSGGNMPSMGALSTSDLPWNFVPVGAPGQTFTAPPTSGMNQPPAPPTGANIYSGMPYAPAPQRSLSAGPRGSPAPGTPRARTPSALSPTAMRMAGLPQSRPHTPYEAAPIPPGVRYPDPRQSRPPSQTANRTPVSMSAELPPSFSRAMSPRSTSSRLSGHQRSLSMHAGSTPAAMSRTLTPDEPGAAPTLRRVPSAGSIASTDSRLSGNYARYDSKEFLEPAFLASSEDLGVQSPHTMANTRANAAPLMVPGPRAPSRASSRLSYTSGRSRE
ncbi:hypothetical protein CERSUDRAFT_70793 [Gelatoporia subvermispora B]|uniref:Uncharacterized protein n=1 Tax=Ceriporiopsis subvermispora (strain B) TaxID=914234 RepID=M2QTQ2_CERS8|nr:hypothetical protein CERSUDRAFT_70793 [Gelatoporia subvermispora B]